MYIHDVIPVQKGIPLDILSYYYPAPLESGTLVTIRIQSKSYTALVFSVRPLLEEKTSIRNAPFALKKIESVLLFHPLLAHLATALARVGSDTLAPLGSLLASTLSDRFLELLVKSLEKKEIRTEKSETGEKKKKKSTLEIVIGGTDTRLARYKEYIRASFAQKKSVVIVTPTILDAEFLCEKLSKGIEKKTWCMHSKRKVKELGERVREMLSASHPVLLIATVPFSLLLREDVGGYIIEKESSDFYESNDRFHIDTRRFIEHWVEACGVELVRGDVLPRFRHFVHTLIPRLLSPDALSRTELIVPTMQKNTLLPKEIEELLQFAEKKKRTLFFYSHRRGLAPLSRCRECATVVSCPNCALPLSLKKETKEGVSTPLYSCNTCGYTTSAHYTCTTCKSWNIASLDIGTESLVASIRSLVGPLRPIVVLDQEIKNQTPEERQKRELPGTIYVGTEHFFPYVSSVDYVIAPFFDRMLGTPSYETMEKALRVLLLAEDTAQKKALIFTNATHVLFRHIKKGTLNHFISEELALRKQFGFPPFGVFIRITISASPHAIDTVSSECGAVFQSAGLTPRDLGKRLVSSARSQMQRAWILLVSVEWVKEEGPFLVQKLLGVTPSLSLEVNPHYFSL